MKKIPTDHELTPPARIACAISRFRVHLACNEIIEATKIFDRLVSISGPRDPIVRRLRLRLIALMLMNPKLCYWPQE